jgi:hypothetical protein
MTADKKSQTAGDAKTQNLSAPTTDPQLSTRKRWIKLTPRDHVLKQIKEQKKLVDGLRAQLQKEEQTLEGMEKAKAFFPE